MSVLIKSGLSIDDYTYKKITVVEFMGSLTEQNLDPIKQEFIKKFNSFQEYVAFDLSKVPFVSMDTLKQMVDLNKQLQVLKKKCFLINLHKPVYKFLSGTALANIFVIMSNEEQVFQQYLSDKNLSEEDVQIFSSANELNKWYNKILTLLSELKDSDLKISLALEDFNCEMSIIIISNNIVLGRGLNEPAKKYKLIPHLINAEKINEKISATDNLAGYLVDGFTQIEEIKEVIEKIRTTESDYGKSLLPILVSSKVNYFQPKQIMKLNDMVYYLLDDSELRESKLIKKVRSLYENIDKVVVYLTPKIKFELTTEICTFYFFGKITEEDSELFDGFFTDEFVNEIMSKMFTINFNYYECMECDDLFFVTIQNLSEKYEQCVHFMTKADTQLNRGIKSIPLELNINVL